MTKSLPDLLRELDSANPFRAAELARQLDAATEVVRRQAEPFDRSGLDQTRAVNALVEQQARQFAAVTEALLRQAEPFERLRAEQERTMAALNEQQDRLASALRYQADVFSRTYEDQIEQVLRRQAEFEQTIRRLAEEHERLLTLLERRSTDAQSQGKLAAPDERTEDEKGTKDTGGEGGGAVSGTQV